MRKLFIAIIGILAGLLAFAYLNSRELDQGLTSPFLFVLRDTHKSKAFYIRKEIAKLIEQDIRNSSRGDMTKIANALFEEYYRSQGRLK